MYFDLFYASHISSILKGHLTASHLSPEPLGLGSADEWWFWAPQKLTSRSPQPKGGSLRKSRWFGGAPGLKPGEAVAVRAGTKAVVGPSARSWHVNLLCRVEVGGGGVLSCYGAM